MRDLKFRAWDKTHDSMVSWEKILQHCDRLSFLALKDYEVMQYTGLKDKNGKEIYEGDIVKLHAQKMLAEMIGPVIYGTYGNLCCQFVCASDLNGGGYRNLTEYEIVEVIGNIHENPELLTRTVEERNGR